MRTFGSVFTHADDMHLYWNMGSLLVKGVLLEHRLGSEALAVFVAFSIVASSGIQLVVAPFLARAFGYDCGCAVGFSGVLFAMKVVLNYGDHAAGSNATSSVWGVRVASRHAHWLEILVSGICRRGRPWSATRAGLSQGCFGSSYRCSMPSSTRSRQGGRGGAGAQPLHGRARHRRPGAGAETPRAAARRRPAHPAGQPGRGRGPPPPRGALRVSPCPSPLLLSF